MTSQLRTPTETISRKDLVAAAMIDRWSVDELMNTIALMQNLQEGEQLLKVRGLKTSHVGSYVRIVDGPAGVMSDIKPFDRAPTGGTIQMVLAGKMEEPHYEEYVVVTAIAN